MQTGLPGNFFKCFLAMCKDTNQLWRPSGSRVLILSVAEVKESIDPWKASPVGPARPRRFLLLLHGSIIKLFCSQHHSLS